MKQSEIIKKYVAQNKKSATIHESLMMLKLKVNFIKFDFQYPIIKGDTFIICDFFIPKYKLVIELDGAYHDEILQAYKDIERDKFLISKGYKVIRLWNKDVDTFDTSSIKDIEIPKIKKVAQKSKYSLAQKAEDKKKMNKVQFKKKYGKK